MSGGTFNYLCYKSGVEMLEYENLENLERVESTLREMGFHEAANEIFKYVLKLKTAENHLQIMHDRLAGIMRAVEWHTSGDSGPEYIAKEWQKLIDESLGANHEKQQE